MKRTAAVILALLILCATFAFLAEESLVKKSLTLDETVYIPAGTLIVEKGDWSFNPEQPPVPKLLAGLANHRSGLIVPEPFELTGFLKANKQSTVNWTNRARRPMVFLGVLTVLGVFALAARIGGVKAGFLAALLAAFSPNLLAHSRLVTGDLPLACFAVWSGFFFIGLLRRINPVDLLGLGIAFGLALGSKFTALLLPGLLLLAGLIAHFVGVIDSKSKVAPTSLKSQLFSLAAAPVLILAISAGVIWTLYGYQIGPILPLIEPELKEQLLLEKVVAEDIDITADSDNTSDVLATGILNANLPAPSFWHGLLKTWNRRSGEYAYLLGRISYEGWWYYYPICLLVKTPPGVLAAFLVWIILAAIKRQPIGPGEILCLVMISGVLAFFSLQKVNLGSRYILLINPFLFVLLGTLTYGLEANKHLRLGLVTLLALSQIGSALSIRPDYLAYFNRLAGGPEKGGQWLADSNLDWGQDVPALVEFTRSRGIKRIKFATSGNVDPAVYGLDYHYLPSPFFVRAKNKPGTHTCGPVDGWAAVGITTLTGVHSEPEDCYRWLAKKTPAAHAGHSILIYDLGPAGP